MRRSIRKPMSERAKQLAVKKLIDLEKLGHSPTDVLQQSILNSWQGLFPVQAPRVAVGMNGKHATHPTDPLPDPRTPEQIESDDRRYQDYLESEKAKGKR